MPGSLLTPYIAGLRAAPTPLNAGQKALLAGLSLLVAISRAFALSTSQLDWDEALFAGGVRSYDVTSQHPHPPGYPLFIFFAKIARWFVHGDFRSLRTVVAIASFLLFPAAFFLLRELRARFRVAVTGALLTAFMPTVWYYGGTGLSDIPALCAIVAASALLIAGGRSPRLWIAGMAMAGIAGGIRPLHVVIAIAPALIGAAAMRRQRAILIGIAVFALVVGASYAGAALATRNPPWGYLNQLGATAHHIRTVDSFHNDTRPPLPKLASMFFVYSHRGGTAGIVLLALGVIGALESLIRRRIWMAVVLAMFVPIAIVTWAMLDLTAVTRYGLAYAMLYAITAAQGLDAVSRVLRWAPAQTVVVTGGAAALSFALIVWTWPALTVVRHDASPPVAAMEWIRTHVPISGPTIYIDDALAYHADYELQGYDKPSFRSYDEIPARAYVAGNYCLVDRPTIQPHSRYYSFPRARLGQIARDVYFETSIIQMDSMIQFRDGWYQDEYDADRIHAWRWMQQSSIALFPVLESNGVIRLRFHVPLNSLPHPPKMTVRWNGALIEERVCNQEDFVVEHTVPSSTGAPNECRITTDEVATARGDARQFGLQLSEVSWERANGVR